jgi:signal-transduction protein with cAMP-binding, CBS, and nucleotidyltransferase domain
MSRIGCIVCSAITVLSTAQFAKATVAFETPLGFFTNFVLEKNRDELDIKKGGIFPIVHGVRSLALEYRCRRPTPLTALPP